MGTPHRTLAGRYRLDALIARGGMGEVWRARDLELGRPVAVKVVRDELARDTTVSERFRREARAAASLAHPNVAAVYDLVEDQGRLAIVMELVDGVTLAEWLRRHGAMPTSDAVFVADGVLAALDEAHGAGIVHRDVSPGNVMLTDDGVKVTDFGVATMATEAATRLTATGTVLGTAPYLAPEQVEGRPTTPATDQYALGVVLYEALTGQLPFRGDSPAATALARLTTDPPPLRAHRADVSADLEAAVMRALARDPRDRFGSAAEMRGALQAATRGELADEDVTAPQRTTLPLTMPLPPGPSPAAAAEATMPAPRRRVVLAVMAVVAAALAALVGALTIGAFETEAITVPDLIGTTDATARAVIAEAGLRVGEVTSEHAPAAAGTVIRQDPVAGTTVEPGAPTHLVVSAGPPPPPVDEQDDDKDDERDDDKDDERDDDKDDEGPGKGKGKGNGRD